MPRFYRCLSEIVGPFPNEPDIDAISHISFWITRRSEEARESARSKFMSNCLDRGFDLDYSIFYSSRIDIEVCSTTAIKYLVWRKSKNGLIILNENVDLPDDMIGYSSPVDRRR